AECDQITWAQAARAAGVSSRTLRRWRQRYEEFGYEGLLDHRVGLKRDWSSSRGQ
ncbi:MAG: helix-turn-helix domain-containing protein, partial [Deltaproteobacteria bacterium]|nr:helix-turn-helix domain-containing protein [Deltaproteobacteria bacterium]